MGWEHIHKSDYQNTESGTDTVHTAEKTDLSDMKTETKLTFPMNPKPRSVTHLQCSNFYGCFTLLSVHKGRKRRRGAGQGIMKHCVFREAKAHSCRPLGKESYDIKFAMQPQRRDR